MAVAGRKPVLISLIKLVALLIRFGVLSFNPKLGTPIVDRFNLLKTYFEASTLFTDKVITLQSQKKHSKSDRNNVRFL